MQICIQFIYRNLIESGVCRQLVSIAAKLTSFNEKTFLCQSSKTFTLCFLLKLCRSSDFEFNMFIMSKSLWSDLVWRKNVSNFLLFSGLSVWVSSGTEIIPAWGAVNTQPNPAPRLHMIIEDTVSHTHTCGHIPTPHPGGGSPWFLWIVQLDKAQSCVPCPFPYSLPPFIILRIGTFLTLRN